MRVLCIDNGPMINNLGHVRSAPDLTEGEVYTVEEALYGGYVLVEVKPSSGAPGFNWKRFVPLTGNETEVIKEEEVEHESLMH